MIKYLHAARVLACALVFFTLTRGFAAAGDLGRADPNFWDGLFPKQLYLGPVAPLSFPPADMPHSLYPLTDDEASLREQSFSILQPPQHREVWKTLMASWVEATAFPLDILRADPYAYANMLVGMPFASEAGRYSRLIDDVGSDYLLLGPFMTTACRVVDMDARRAQSLAHVPAFTEYEIKNALARNDENRTLIEGAELTLNDRVWSYRYAVNRLVIAVPSRLAVAAERAVERYAVQVAAIAPYLAKCIPPGAVVEHGPPPAVISK
ncbi:MAG: hypothetical protein JO328_14685 [Hyphomicrobiales bacterium]|nr:hypothetical protein [Hyphomicrobiales bacterium]MBV8825355.1 hypothetical protein [Hyphomicrobiales bacterium]MBV9426157.1 hypothetical protein [Bradyrhizobiaceae bacterium]